MPTLHPHIIHTLEWRLLTRNTDWEKWMHQSGFGDLGKSSWVPLGNHRIVSWIIQIKCIFHCKTPWASLFLLNKILSDVVFSSESWILSNLKPWFAKFPKFFLPCQKISDSNPLIRKYYFNEYFPSSISQQCSNVRNCTLKMSFESFTQAGQCLSFKVIQELWKTSCLELYCSNGR